MKFVNLTSTNIKLKTEDGTVTFPSTGKVATCKEKVSSGEEYEDENGNVIPILDRGFGELSNLPPPDPNVIYITSAIAATAASAQGRDDVVYPARTIKSNGKIVGCRVFCRPA